LNRRGVPTLNGGPWHSTTVIRVKTHTLEIIPEAELSPEEKLTAQCLWVVGTKRDGAGVG
jgi:hypothetical protein